MHINCFYEKRLIVAHYFAEQKDIGNNTITLDDVIQKWQEYFPKDFKKIKYDRAKYKPKRKEQNEDIIKKMDKVFCWLTEYIKTRDVFDVEYDIVGCRRKQLNILYDKFSIRNFHVRMTDIPVASTQVMKYEVVNGRFSRIGNYDNLSRFFDKIIENLENKKVS